jgi:two-component sensor histidine kinase
MREMQHRTKNNLQTIISFLSLQRRQADTPASRDSFTRVIERVHAIALAHDQLSLKEGIDHIEFGEYIRALCMNIDPRRDALNVVVDASVATMPLDRAVPAGLIVNELLTNAFKYAFDEGQEGVVRVVFEVDADTGQGCILVEDNGKGMGPVRKGGLGLTLINAFARQLGGHLECHEVKKGTRTSIRFPLVI